MNASMTTGVATAVRIVPMTVRQRLDQMARNVTTACASFATALREVALEDCEMPKTKQASTRRRRKEVTPALGVVQPRRSLVRN